MAIRESIVFEVDATAAAQGFSAMEKGADAMATSVARADDALTAVQKEAAALGAATSVAGKAATELTGAVATQATATAQAATQTGALTKALTAEATAAQSANVALESTARTVAVTARTAESASRGIGQVARASGEPIARLATILGGPELGGGIARMFQLERGLHSVGQVGAAAGVGLSRFLAPLAIAAVAVEGVSLALSFFTDNASKATKEIEKLEGASTKLAASTRAVETRLASLTGADRIAALSSAIDSARSEITKLGEGGGGLDFKDLDQAKARLSNWRIELGDSAAALSDFQDKLAKTATIAGQEFVPVDLFKPLLKDFPAISIAIDDLQAQGVPGLIALQDAMNLLAEAQTSLSKATKDGTAAFSASVDAIQREAAAIQQRHEAVQALVVSGVRLETALRSVSDRQEAQTRVEREASALAKEFGTISDEKRAALLKEAEASIAARRAFEGFVESQQNAIDSSRELGQTISGVVVSAFDRLKSIGGAITGGISGAAGAIAGGFGDASSDRSRAAEAAGQIETSLRLEAASYARTRTEVEKLALEEDLRANRFDEDTAKRLRGLQAEAQALRKVREVSDGLGGGVGDSLRALKDGASGKEAVQAGLHGAGDRLFAQAVGDIEERIGAGFASLFGGTFGISPGEQAIVSAVDRVTAAIGAAGAAGGGTGIGAAVAGGGAAAAGGFNFGAFGTSLAIGGLGLLFGGLGRNRGRNGGNNDSFEVAPFERGGRGSGTTYNQNRVTVNNFGSADRAPLTGRQAKRDPSRIWR